MILKLKKNGSTAEVSTKGAELISYKNTDGTEFIWNGDPAFWSGRNPVLFPVVGNLKDGRITIKGDTYEMNRHGFARNTEFSVADHGEDFVVFRLTENEETLKRYPYPFLFEVCHQLTDEGFATSFTVKNTGTEPLPYCVGAHTAINCPLASETGAQFEDYQLVFDKDETARSIPLTSNGLISDGERLDIIKGGRQVPLAYDVFGRIDTVIFDGLASTGVNLVHKKTGRGVRMEFAGFPMIAFWTKPGAPYLCLEPWHGCAAAENESGIFEDKFHCIILKPGEKKTLTFYVKPLQ